MRAPAGKFPKFDYKVLDSGQVWHLISRLQSSRIKVKIMQVSTAKDLARAGRDREAGKNWFPGRRKPLRSVELSSDAGFASALDSLLLVDC